MFYKDIRNASAVLNQMFWQQSCSMFAAHPVLPIFISLALYIPLSHDYTTALHMLLYTNCHLYLLIIDCLIPIVDKCAVFHMFRPTKQEQHVPYNKHTFVLKDHLWPCMYLFFVTYSMHSLAYHVWHLDIYVNYDVRVPEVR